MNWFVYNFNINAQKIEKYDIFKHGGFREYATKAAKKYKNREEFAEQIKRELMYYFWSKCEYELIVEITENNCILLIPWCGCKTTEQVDVTDIKDFDWRGFAEKHIRRQVYKNRAKIDIYDQVNYVWDDFIEYVWQNRKKLM